MLFLPSESLLQKYKNCIQQSPGINHSMFEWLHVESERLKSEKRGGLILDEMSIQEDLQLSFGDGKVFIDGLVDMGSFCEDMRILNTHTKIIKPATHVLQFIYLGYDDFRFPIAYFPSSGATAPELYTNVWDLISKLNEIDINIDYVCFDGSSNNRAFQFMHFTDKEDSKNKNFTTINPYNPSETVTMIMDYSHNIKKIRNNIYASGDHEICTRKLKLKEKYIVWAHWIEAFHWDRIHNPVRVHQRLTNDHIFLTKLSKMRNHLAEEVLDENMLHLMKKIPRKRKRWFLP